MEARQAFIASFPYVIKGEKRNAFFALRREYPIPPKLIFLLNLIS
jgi:hypothetical protein